MAERKIKINFLKREIPLLGFACLQEMYCMQRKTKEVEKEGDSFSFDVKQKEIFGVFAGKPLHTVLKQIIAALSHHHTDS